MHLSQSGSRSDKRKARGRGLPPSSGVVCLTRAKLFGFCPAVLQWHFVAFGRRVLFVCTCATVPWEWLHKVLCASRVSIPRPSNLLALYEQVCVVVVVCCSHPQNAFSGPHAPQRKHHVAICFFDLACHDATVDALLLQHVLEICNAGQ